jgi:hypothetical protein
MIRKLELLKFIDTKRVKNLFAVSKLGNIRDSIFGRRRRAMDGPGQDPRIEGDFSKEEKLREQATAGYVTGKLLLSLGVIEEGQLTEALRRQRALQEKGIRKSLGVLLVEMGYTTSKEYLEVLSRYFDMPIISLLKFIPSRSVQSALVDRYAYNHKLLILAERETEVNLALADPNPLILDELKKIFKLKKINFFLANPFEIERCFRMCPDPYASTFYR